MLDGGDVACVMEVSSHALELARVDAVSFAAGIFTNLTQDHLDFHPTMEDYFLAKRKLFTECRVRTAIINIDDPYGRRLAADPEIVSAITFALDDPAATTARLRSRRISPVRRFTLQSPDGVRQLRSPLTRALQRLQRARRARRRSRARGPCRRCGCRDRDGRSGARPL